MSSTPSRFATKALALLLALVFFCPSLPSQEQSDYLIHVQSDLVLVNVTVRDKSGKFVQGLKPENFTILEDNKPQKVVSFDVENVDAVRRRMLLRQSRSQRHLQARRIRLPPPRTWRPNSQRSSKIAV